MEQRIVRLQPTYSKNHIPNKIWWKNERILKNHSFKSAMLEIVKMSQSVDVVSINIIGPPGTGKTTIAKTAGHVIHRTAKKEYNTDYAVKLFDKDNLMNFKETLKNLEPVNQILIFDDVSFLGANSSKQEIEIVKQGMTEIRHLEGGQDIKVIKIQNFHYTLGMDKYMRQNDYSLYTNVGSSELENMQKIVGTRYTSMLLEFQKKVKMAQTVGKFQFKLGHKRSDFFIYSYRNPFIPVLFHNGSTLRYIVSPTRDWIDPYCTTCINSKGEKIKGAGNAKELKEELMKFGVQIAKRAITIKLMQQGVNVQPKRVKQCLTYLDRRLDGKNFDLKELAVEFGFTDEKTRLDIKSNENLNTEITEEKQDATSV